MSAEASRDRHLTPSQKLIVEWKMKVKDAGLDYLSTALAACLEHERVSFGSFENIFMIVCKFDVS